MSKLFEPIQVGDLTLQHRVVLAPLTRLRASTDHVLQSVMKEYYTQRATYPGTLLISEATFIAPQAGGYGNVPGIWSDDQIAAWKEITESVHASGSFIFLQLWALGRAADEKHLKSENPAFPYISASDIPLAGSGNENPPRPLTVDEIQEYIGLYAKAAANAVHKAGFDGVEVHCANGYLLDQFLQDVSNKREDDYGGSVENRARFGLEVVDAVVKEVGVKKVGVRLSPWSPFQEMGMKDPIPTFSYFISHLPQDLAYIHLVEPRVSGNATLDHVDASSTNDPFRAIWSPRPFISAGGYTRENAIEVADEKGGLIAFGRHFISNPDLVKRLQKGIALTPYNRDTFYIPGDTSGKGYTDYPFADE